MLSSLAEVMVVCLRKVLELEADAYCRRESRCGCGAGQRKGPPGVAYGDEKKGESSSGERDDDEDQIECDGRG